MAEFESKETLLKAIQDGFSEMNAGNLDLEKMEKLVDNSRKLYERLVVIRHKAFELKANQQPVKIEAEIEQSIEETPKMNTPEPEKVSVEEPKIEETFTEQKSEEKVIVQTKEVTQRPEIDMAFDLFGAPESVEEVAPTETAINDSTQENEPLVEEEKVDDSFKSIASIVEENNILNEIKPEITPQASTQPTNISPTSAPSFFSNYESITVNPKAMMTAPKIESLNAAFGLNEKLVYIRELFNGSSEEFNQAIAKIESVNSFDEAKNSLNETALNNHWRLDQEATLDFIHKVERRFFK